MTNLCFIEIRSRHPARCAPFYSVLVADPDVANVGQEAQAIALGKTSPFGAIMQMPPQVPLVTCCYLAVTNCVVATRSAAQLGANVLLPQQQLDEATFSLILDPWGNHLALWEDRDHAYRDLELPICGLLLTVSDLSIAEAFYHAVLGECFHHQTECRALVARSPRFSLALVESATGHDPLPLVAVDNLDAQLKTLERLGGSRGDRLPDLPMLYQQAQIVKDPEQKPFALIVV